MNCWQASLEVYIAHAEMIPNYLHLNIHKLTDYILNVQRIII